MLAGISSSLSIALVGCLGGGQPLGNGETSSSGTVNDLAYSATVLEQRSTDSPARIRTELTNSSEQEIEISAKETIVLRYNNGPGFKIILLPKTDVGPNDPPEEASGECWRYSKNNLLARDIEVWHSVNSKEAFRETYSVFTKSDDTQCLVSGEYWFTDTIQDRENNKLGLLLNISISNSNITVEADEKI